MRLVTPWVRPCSLETGLWGLMSDLSALLRSGSSTPFLGWETEAVRAGESIPESQRPKRWSHIPVLLVLLHCSRKQTFT